MKKISRALISVSDKDGLVDFAKSLEKLGVEIMSTGGTAKLLADSGVKVQDVSDYTGFPEMMAGRVKTLHPKVHGGILGRRGKDDEVMAKHQIQGIDLVVVNLYPFAQTVAKPDCSLEDAIENIDICGPAMLRSAAKNHADVTVIVNSSDYTDVIKELEDNSGSVSQATRFDLAVKAFEHTASYDGAIANYLGKISSSGEKQNFSQTINLQYQQVQEMRYGENPHQRAAFFVEQNAATGTISTAKQLQGKELSFNNIADTDAALECVKQFTDEPSCVIVKHANPCGVATADSLLEAYEQAWNTDQESAFGGIIAFNRPLEADVISAILDRQFVEVIVAPKVSAEAVEVAKAKKNVRLLETGDWSENSNTQAFKQVAGGLLVQDVDAELLAETKVATKRQPTETEMTDLLFAWKVAKFVKSNAIVYCKNKMTIGVGAGQMSRVNSARIAGIKAEQAGLEVEGSVMASDAFFPFRDGLDNAAAAGIKAVIQPGGSMRDDEVIAAADEHGIAMIFTSMRHFRH